MNKVLGHNIRKFRESQNLSRRQLAERINRSARQLQKYESGETAPPLETIGLLAEELGVDVCGLLKTHRKKSTTPVREFLMDLVENVLEEDVFAELGEPLIVRHQILDGYINRHVTISVWKNTEGFCGTKNKLKAVHLSFHENLAENLENCWEFGLGHVFYPLYDNPDQPIEFSSYGKTFEEAEAEAQLHFAALKREVKKRNDLIKAGIESNREARRAELEKQLEALNE